MMVWFGEAGWGGKGELEGDDKVVVALAGAAATPIPMLPAVAAVGVCQLEAAGELMEL